MYNKLFYPQQIQSLPQVHNELYNNTVIIKPKAWNKSTRFYTACCPTSLQLPVHVVDFGLNLAAEKFDGSTSLQMLL